MINVEDVIYDADFAQTYIVHREVSTWIGGRITTTETAYTYTGVITASNVKELMQLPEADRVSGLMTFYSGAENQLFLTRMSDTQGTETDNNDGISDQIEWRGNRYKVIKVWPYVDYGYWKCVAARMAGA